MSVCRLTSLLVDMCLVVLAPVVEKRIFALFHGRNQLSVPMIDVSLLANTMLC